MGYGLTIHLEDVAVYRGQWQAVLGRVKNHERRTVAYPDFLDAAVRDACMGKGQEDRLWNSEEGGFLRPGNAA